MMHDQLIDPMTNSVHDMSPAIKTVLAMTSEEVLDMTKKHRDRVIECIQLLDLTSAEYPVFRNGPHWARVHLVEELIRLERIIDGMVRADKLEKTE